MTAKKTPISTVGVIDHSAFTHQLSIAGIVTVGPENPLRGTGRFRPSTSPLLH